MHEERLLILKMVESGKITAQEAAELLEAMEEEDMPRQAKNDDVWRRIEKQGEELTRKIERAAERFSQSIETKLEEAGISEQLSSIQRWLTKLPFLSGIANDVHEFVQEVEGRFTPDLEEIPIVINTVNGAIEVEGWDGEGFKLVATHRIRAKDREAARDKMTQIDLPQPGSAVSRLEIKVHEKHDTSIAFRLCIPRKGPYALSLKSANGRCRVNGVLARNVEINTLNGSVGVGRAKAETIITKTNNGSNNLDYVEANLVQQRTANGSIKFTGSSRRITCDSTNGSVRVAPLTFAHETSEIEINTVNGSVRCLLPQLPDLEVKVDASSSVGRVSVDLANFAVESEQRSGCMHKVVGAVAGQTGGSKSIVVRTRTGCGSVYVGNERDNNGTQ